MKNKQCVKNMISPIEKIKKTKIAGINASALSLQSVNIKCAHVMNGKTRLRSRLLSDNARGVEVERVMYCTAISSDVHSPY
jgi:hypothetical protein